MGLSTAALAVGGSASKNNTELWNGTNWTNVNTLNQGRRDFGGAGTTTAGLVFGGTPGPGDLTELWNGTNWTEVADLNVSDEAQRGCGTQPAALSFGGQSDADATEEWNITGGISTIETS